MENVPNPQRAQTAVMQSARFHIALVQLSLVGPTHEARSLLTAGMNCPKLFTSPLEAASMRYFAPLALNSAGAIANSRRATTLSHPLLLRTRRMINLALLNTTLFTSLLLLSAPAGAKIARTQAEHICHETAKQAMRIDTNSTTPNNRKRVGFSSYSACMRSKGFQL